MGAREYDDWVAYYEQEPWGAYRDNLHAGLIAAAIINHAPGRKRGSKVAKPGDFILTTKSEQRRSDTARSLSYLRAIAKRKADDN